MMRGRRLAAGLGAVTLCGTVVVLVLGSGSAFRSAALVPGSARAGDLTVSLPAATATLTPPANGAGWNTGGTVDVALSATETGPVGIGSITYSATGAQAIAATTVSGPTATVAVTAEGATLLTYTAADNAGRTGSPQTATVRLDRSGPNVAMSDPGSALVDGATTLAATASDSGSGVASVQFLAQAAGASGFVPIGSPLTASPYQLSWDTTAVSNGDAHVEAMATDVAGNQTTSSPVTVTIDHGGDPVTTATVTPAPNAAGWSNGPSVTVGLSATDTNGPGVASVSYGMSGATVVSTTAVSGPTAAPTVSAEGITTVSYFATDTEGRAAPHQSLAVSIDRTPPTGAMTAPAPGSVSGTVPVSATAADGLSGVASVQFEVQPAGGTSFVDLGAPITTAPYQLSWDTATGAFLNGTTLLQAVVTDVAGNVTTVPAVTLTLANGAAPAPAPPPPDAPTGTYSAPLATTVVTGATQQLIIPVAGTDGTAGSVTVTVPGGALPPGTTFTVYSTDLSAVTGALPADGTASAAFAIAWRSTDPANPTPAAGVPITVTFSDPSIVTGSTVQELTSNGVLVWYPADVSTGQVSLTITFDPVFVITAPKRADGYWLAAGDGGVFSFGQAPYFGGLGGTPLNRPIVALASTPDRRGYWLTGSDGGVFSFGGAGFYGSTGGLHLSQPIVGIAATPTGAGYWLVAADGGVFAFGDAGFYGSTGGLHLNQPIVGMAATPTGRGYWLVASDGGVFAFGDAGFYGSAGGLKLNRQITSLAPSASGHGYWMTGSDGGVFAFGDAPFLGSAGGEHLAQPIVSMTASPTGLGYWLTGSDGSVFAFGDGSYLGGTSGRSLHTPIVGMADR